MCSHHIFCDFGKSCQHDGTRFPHLKVKIGHINIIVIFSFQVHNSYSRLKHEKLLIPYFLDILKWQFHMLNLNFCMILYALGLSQNIISILCTWKFQNEFLAIGITEGESTDRNHMKMNLADHHWETFPL